MTSQYSNAVISCLLLQFGIGLILLAAPILSLHQWRKYHTSMILRWPEMQFGIWVSLLIVSIVCLFSGKMLITMLLLVCAQLFPKYKPKKPITLSRIKRRSVRPD
jgi:hypothetical protein